MYMMWFDDSTKKTVSVKIEEAIEAYVRHFRSQPNVVLVSEGDRVEMQGVRIRSAQFIRRDNYWVGWEDPKIAA